MTRLECRDALLCGRFPFFFVLKHARQANVLIVFFVFHPKNVSNNNSEENKCEHTSLVD